LYHRNNVLDMNLLSQSYCQALRKIERQSMKLD
jgi:hypothetical protein